jgi:hypothetical protein
MVYFGLFLSVWLGSGLLNLPLTPYLDVEGSFYPNYTGECVYGNPALVFTNAVDSLDVDSLLEIYNGVLVLDSLSFVGIITQKLEEHAGQF